MVVLFKNWIHLLVDIKPKRHNQDKEWEEEDLFLTVIKKDTRDTSQAESLQTAQLRKFFFFYFLFLFIFFSFFFF